MTDTAPVLQLTDQEKKDLSLAIIFWKDYIGNTIPPEMGTDLTKRAGDLVEKLGLHDQYVKLLSKVPKMWVEPRDRSTFVLE